MLNADTAAKIAASLQVGGTDQTVEVSSERNFVEGSPLAIVLICLYALFSGHLSQLNFMSMVRWAGERISRLNPFDKSPPRPPK